MEALLEVFMGYALLVVFVGIFAAAVAATIALVIEMINFIIDAKVNSINEHGEQEDD